MEAVCNSEMLVSTYKSTRRYDSEDQHLHVRFAVPKATNINTAVFWDVAQCSLVDIDLHFIVAVASIIRAMITLMMEAISYSETSVYIHQAIWCNTPEDSHLHLHHR
jgi:hypothetical protein